jgi:uncharacterized YigZ family protein
MYCVKSSVSCEELLKKSRFISVMLPCSDENSVLTALKQLHLEHPHATHIAFAYRLKTTQGIVYRFHDAGEPTGTAGKPIFQHLEGKQLINVLVAVIRYFGGVKLGAGGLTRAYGNSAKRAIESAELIDYIEFITVTLTLDYAQLSQLDYQLKKLDGAIVKQDFSEHVQLLIKLPAANVAILKTLFPVA